MGIKKSNQPIEVLQPNFESDPSKRIILRKEVLPIGVTALSDQDYLDPVQEKVIQHAANIRIEYSKAELFIKVKRLKECLTQQWKELEEKEISLRANFIQFSQFIKRNQVKRSKALAGLFSHKEERIKTTVICKELSEKVHRLREVVEQMHKEINKHKIYEEFLATVLNEHKQFQTMEEVVKRFEELMYVKEYATKRSNTFSHQLEKVFIEYAKYRKNGERQILICCRKISKLRKIYDRAIIVARMRYEPIVDIIAHCNRLIANDYRVTQCIIKLFKEILERHEKVGVPMPETSDKSKQLTEIKLNMGILRQIVKSRKPKVYTDISRRRLRLFSAFQEKKKFMKNAELQRAELRYEEAKRQSVAVLAPIHSIRKITEPTIRTNQLAHLNSPTIKTRHFNSPATKTRHNSPTTKARHNSPTTKTHNLSLPTIKSLKASRSISQSKEEHKPEFRSSSKSSHHSSKSHRKFLPHILKSTVAMFETESFDAVDPSRRYFDRVFSTLNMLVSRDQKPLGKKELEDKFRKYECLYSERQRWLQEKCF